MVITLVVLVLTASLPSLPSLPGGPAGPAGPGMYLVMYLITVLVAGEVGSEATGGVIVGTCPPMAAASLVGEEGVINTISEDEGEETVVTFFTGTFTATASKLFTALVMETLELDLLCEGGSVGNSLASTLGEERITPAMLEKEVSFIILEKSIPLSGLLFLNIVESLFIDAGMTVKVLFATVLLLCLIFVVLSFAM